MTKASVEFRHDLSLRPHWAKHIDASVKSIFESSFDMSIDETSGCVRLDISAATDTPSNDGQVQCAYLTVYLPLDRARKVAALLAAVATEIDS